MPKRGPKVKQIVKLLSEGMGENPFPWKKPNNRMRKLIDKQYKDKLEDAVADAQENILLSHLNKLYRHMKGQ